jgi:hypothetical protein
MSLLIVGCESEDEELPNDDNNGNPYGYWKRGNGVNSYLAFTNTTATACTNGVTQVGTFNASVPSMTFVINNDVITFPLQFGTNQLLVGVPEQAINTNNATLYNRSTDFPCDGGGNSDNNPTTGKALFWTSSDQGCGNITVTVSNSSGIISQYYSGRAPNCGASGCANFTLAPGTYSFSASCSSYTWSGSINVTAGGCSQMQLY